MDVPRQVVYESSYGGCRIAEHVKTASGRRIAALPAFTMDLLIDLKGRRQAQATLAGEKWSDERLISDCHDGRPVNPDNAGVEFACITERAGMPALRFHALRHAFAIEFLHRQKADVVMVQHRLGRSGPNATMRMYVLPEFSQQVTGADLLSQA